MDGKEKVVLAYSGGLDTSVAALWLQEQGYEVITFTADVGQPVDLQRVRDKALRVGVLEAYVFDLREEFVSGYVAPIIKANGLYQGKYPLSASISRPLISKYLVWLAKKEGAGYVAHGCTGKGQDQVRFDVSVAALDPTLKVLAPVRDWGMSREEEIDYALQYGIPVDVTKSSPYSIDVNVWGRSIECGPLEDPWVEPPSDAFEWTVDPLEAPDRPTYMEIEFEGGLPVAVDGERMSLLSILELLNKVGGENGVGRIDMIEDRLVGFKSREVYEAPAAKIILEAHRAIESLTLSKELLAFKASVEPRYAELVYTGYWYSPLKQALDVFFDYTQQWVNGKARVKLYKGSCTVVGLASETDSLYKHDLATYSKEDAFDHRAAAGFIKIWGLPIRTWAERHILEDAMYSEEKLSRFMLNV